MEINLFNSLLDVKNSSDFWSKIRSLSLKNHFSLPIQIWEQSFDSIFSTVYVDTFTDFFDAQHPILDSEISLDELELSLSLSKINKAPGLDNINTEFLKFLPSNWKLFLLFFYNKVLECEVTPSSWPKIVFTMLQKKGDPQDPNNYRNIALVNCKLQIYSFFEDFLLQSNHASFFQRDTL